MKEVLKDKRVAALAVVLALGAVGLKIPKTGEGGPDTLSMPNEAELTDNAFTENRTAHTELNDGVVTYIISVEDGITMTREFCSGQRLIDVFGNGDVTYLTGFRLDGENICEDGVIDQADGWVNQESLNLVAEGASGVFPY
jgi:hypothetical protein